MDEPSEGIRPGEGVPGAPPSCPPSEGPGSTNLDGLHSSFELRAKLRQHATHPRIAICGARVYGDPSIVTEETEDGERRARWTGIVLCNRAGCPVCAAAKARKFHRQVLRTLQSGGYWQHVIFTVSHHAGESWERVYWRVMDGLRAMSKGQVGRIVASQIEATIRATETTWSAENGWHVHLHVLWKLKRPLLEEEQRIVREKWADSVAGTRSSEKAWEHAYDHGVTFGRLYHCLQESDRRAAAQYLSKLAMELSGVAKSSKPGHWNLGEIFRAAALPDTPRNTMRSTAIALVREYQRATKGKRLYQLDRRAKLLHDAAPELPELRIVNQWVTPIDRLEFSALARGERQGDPLACYLPLEVAARCRGDPTDAVLDTIYDLAGGFEQA